MKITSTDYLEQLKNSAKTSTGPDLKEDLGFSKILNEQRTSGTPAEERDSEAVGQINSSSLVGMILANGGLDNKTKVDKQLESTLDKMQQYVEAMSDSSKTLKDIGPLAAELELNAGRLSELSHSLPEGDPLKGLSNDTAVLATVEAIKFKRGDYV